MPFFGSKQEKKHDISPSIRLVPISMGAHRLLPCSHLGHRKKAAFAEIFWLKHESKGLQARYLTPLGPLTTYLYSSLFELEDACVISCCSAGHLYVLETYSKEASFFTWINHL